MVDGEFFVDDFLEIGADVAEAEVEALEGLELGGYACGEGADGYVADVAKEVLDAYFFGFFGFDYGGGVHEGFGCCCAVLGSRREAVSMGERQCDVVGKRKGRVHLLSLQLQSRRR